VPGELASGKDRGSASGVELTVSDAHGGLVDALVDALGAALPGGELAALPDALRGEPAREGPLIHHLHGRDPWRDPT